MKSIPSQQDLEFSVLRGKIYNLIQTLQEKSGHVSELLRVLDGELITFFRMDKEMSKKKET